MISENKKRVCISLSKEAYDTLVARTKEVIPCEDGSLFFPTKSMVIELAILYGRYDGCKIVKN